MAGSAGGGKVTPRVALRPAKMAGLTLVEPWYAEAMAAIHGGVADAEEQALEERFKGGGLMLITRGDDAEPIGIVEYRAGWPVRGWATIELIALKQGERGWGYGAEAIKILEERHKGARLLAQIDRRNGLALYFWLRLGYRPARADEIFWRTPTEGGIIAMVRVANNAG